MKRLIPWLVTLLAVALIGGLGWLIVQRLDAEPPTKRGGKDRPVPVEIAPLTRGPISLVRVFHGSLEAHAAFVVAPEIGGRLERVAVDLADEVTRDQLVAELDDAEPRQAMARAEAALSLAQARVSEAESLRRIATRELERVTRLVEKGLGSATQRDTAHATQLARAAQVEVTRAEARQAQAEVASARIRLAQTRVRAAWRDGAETRVVAARYLDPGETVAAHAPLLRVVELDPITVAFPVTETDYAKLTPGQPVQVTTDAYPNQIFSGEITRIAPIFAENTRQARVEARLANPDGKLKPGLFARVAVRFQHEENALLAPEAALTRRDGQTGVFVVDASGKKAVWRPITPDIRENAKVRILEPLTDENVVILGQQWLKDGVSISVANPQD